MRLASPLSPATACRLGLGDRRSGERQSVELLRLAGCRLGIASPSLPIAVAAWAGFGRKTERQQIMMALPLCFLCRCACVAYDLSYFSDRPAL